MTRSARQPAPSLDLDAQISSEQFAWLADFLSHNFGIHLPEQKRLMALSRLQRLVWEEGFSSFQEYYYARLREPTPHTISQLIDRLSTNHTFFWREADHFQFFAEIAIPEAARRQGRGRDLRVWCAAASTGEEPYTLAMLMDEQLGGQAPPWSLGVLATDISQRALQQGKQGVYSQEEASKLPTRLVERYFRPLPGHRLQVSEALRQQVVFRRFNLMNVDLPFRRPFDIIFCRNVMIYFQPDTKRALLERLTRALHPGGHLFVGMAESVERGSLGLQYVRPGVYRRSR